MTGTKFDSEKPKPRLILSDMPRAILEVAKVGTFGANKYSEGNWLEVENGLKRYTDALDRHRLYSAIEDYDQETGLLHAAHLAWNALARLELILRTTEPAPQSP